METQKTSAEMDTETALARKELMRLDRALENSILSSSNYDGNLWMQNDEDFGISQTMFSQFITSDDNNGLIPLALANFQKNYYRPLRIPLVDNKLGDTFITSAGEKIKFEYDGNNFLVPSKKQIREKYMNGEDLANDVSNTHFNVSLFESSVSDANTFSRTKLHVVFRGTEMSLDSVPFKYAGDAYTDMDKYYRQMQIFEKSLFSYLEKHPEIKEVDVTGHSLGGAMAQYFHEKHKDYFEAKGIEVKTTTFGSPGVDTRGYFQVLKKAWRGLRIAGNEVGSALDKMIHKVEEKTLDLSYHVDDINFDNPIANIAFKPVKFATRMLDLTAYSFGAVAKSINNVLLYNKVDSNEYYVNKDSKENKKNYDQDHYHHRFDPIPLAGLLGYKKNGDSFRMTNYLKKQKWTSFMSIMGEHTSDAYTHNITNSILNIYDKYPALQNEVWTLNPRYSLYQHSIQDLVSKKEQIIKESESDPSILVALEDNKFFGKNSRHFKNIGDLKVEYELHRHETAKLLENIFTEAKMATKFTSALVNGIPVNATPVVPSSLLEIIKDIGNNPLTIETNSKTIYHVAEQTHIDTSKINQLGFFGVSLSPIPPTITQIPTPMYDTQASIIELAKIDPSLSNFQVTYTNPDDHLSYGQKVKKHAKNGTLAQILYEQSSTTHVKSLERQTYNEYALQTVNVKNGGLIKKGIDYLAEKISGFPSFLSQPNITQANIDRQRYYDKHGMHSEHEAGLKKALKETFKEIRHPEVLVQLNSEQNPSAKIRQLDEFIAKHSAQEKSKSIKFDI